MTHYSLFSNCASRIRALKTSVTNIKFFNHNPLDGEKHHTNFKLKHYPFCNKDHIYKRIYNDRANLERDSCNYRYNTTKNNLNSIFFVERAMFYIDNGIVI